MKKTILTLLCASTFAISYAQLKMNSNGNIGIGTTVPSSRLEVNNGDLTIKAGSSSATDPGDLIFRSAAGLEYGRIFAFSNALRFRASASSSGDININNSNGYVGIKRLTPSYTLDVGGVARVGMQILWSDERLKSDINKLSVERVYNLYQLNGYSYQIKSMMDEFENGERINHGEVKTNPSIGVMAQEVKELFPELVLEDRDGMMSINYDGLIPVLIEALKDQNERIEALENGESGERSDLDNKEKSWVKQNNPNPFSDRTVIEYNIASEFEEAQVIIYDLTGAQKQLIDLRGLPAGSVQVNASDLYKGMFIYALIVDGTPVDSKNMVVK